MPDLFTLIGAAPTTAATVAPSAPFVSDATAPSPGFVLPVAPAGKVLFPYQVAAVEAILVHRHVVLGFAPGMGKTAILQAAAAAEVGAGGRVVVVVPPSLRIDPWGDFAADYPHLRVAVVEGTKPAPVPAADVLIVGDSVLSYRLADLVAFAPTMVAGDEAHRYKSRTAKRAQAFLALADTASAVVTMTGTLAVNRPDEVYMPLRATGERVAAVVSGGKSWTAYRNRWCLTETIWTGSRQVEVVVGCKDTVGLHAALRQSCYVRVEREEVLDLPGKGWSVRSLHLNGSAAQYRRMERDFIAWVRENHGDKAAGRARKAEAITRMMALWQEAGVASIPATVEYVENMVEQGEQVVVMAWHGKVIDGILAGLAEAKISTVKVVGGMGSQAKADAAASFQAGQVSVLVGQIEAAGVGITLHKAANLVFAQLPWSPGSLQQAADRIYRIGQHRDVTIHVLNGHDTVADKLWAVIQSKAEVVDAINAGQPVTIDPDSVVEGVLSGYGW